MGQEIDQIATFWQNPYVMKLQPKAKLALRYAMDCQDDNRQVIIEDMSLATGLESSECADWIGQFLAQGVIEKSVSLS